MATFTSTSQRVTISGTYKSFTGDSGNTTTVINRSSGDAPASSDAGRFLLWKNGSNTGDWEVRFIQSATTASVTVTDGGFSSAPASGDTFVISTNLDDINTAFADSVVRKTGRSYQFIDRDFELASGAFLADVNASLSCDSQQTGAGFIGTYPVADGCVLQFGRLIGGEANGSTETVGGCQLWFETNNNTLLFTSQGAFNSNGPVLNFYGSLLESSGPAPFIRAPGPMRIIGCICDGPMGGRLYSAASELVDTRFSGNASKTVSWSLGSSFTRPISNAFFFQNNTSIKAFEGWQGTFSDTTFAESNSFILDTSSAQGTLQFNFVDCTTFSDSAIQGDKGNFEQLKSIRYTLTDSSGAGLTGVKVGVYDNVGLVQGGGVQTSASGALPVINARFFRKDHLQSGVDKSPFDIRIRRYGYVYLDFRSAVSEPIKQEVRLNANQNLVSSEAQAAAITGIALNFSTETLTITEDTTSQQLYDFYQYELDKTANMIYGEDLVRTGTAFNLDDWDMVVDGCEYTGDITTSGTITLLNGGLIIGEATDSGGTTTVTVLTLAGLQVNSEVRVFIAGTENEIAGIENSGTSFSANISVDSVDIVVHSLAYEYLRSDGVDTTGNLTLPVQQRVDRNYNNP